MKQTLRLRGDLCPKTEPSINLLYTIFITFTIVLVSCVCTRAQVSASSQEAGPAAGAVTLTIPEAGLKIGDTVPEELWNVPLQVVNHPEGKELITLDDYKGKFIILDFWATWCGNCLKSFPELDSLQRENPRQLEIVLVNTASTGDKKERIEAFFEKRTNPAGNKYVLTTIISDTLFNKFFKHASIPHYVWVGDQRNIIAITDSKEASRKNILSVINGEGPSLKRKKSLSVIDPSKSNIPTDKILKTEKELQGNLSKYIEGLGSWKGIVGKNGLYNKIYHINQTLLTLYKGAYVKSGVFPLNRIQLPATDRDFFISGYRENETYCYELTVNIPTELDSLYASMQKDLSTYFGYDGQFEKKKTDSWVITVVDSTKIIKSHGGISDNNLHDQGIADKYINNESINSLVSFLNSKSPQPVVDMTGIKYRIDMVLPSDLSDWETLRKSLNRYGLEIRKEPVEMEVLVISKKK